MKKIYLLDDVIISPLGFTTKDNLRALEKGISGLKYLEKNKFCPAGCYAAIIEESLLNQKFEKIGNPRDYSKLEKMMLLSVQEVISKNPGLDLKTTRLIVATTKGNINLLKGNSNFSKKRIYLYELGEVIKEFFGFKSQPVIISNACISGGLALSYAHRMIQIGKFQNALVVAGDLVTDFVVSGFNSFQALSAEPCKPFSKNRDGISLGESAGAILVSEHPKEISENICILGDSVTNDANHISGPSRTGEGLFLSIQKALKEAKVLPEQIDYISAHGTATVYNDEMEAIALSRAGLDKIPVNSFKPYYGHTLGASALIESILTKHSLLENKLFKNLNYDEKSVSKPLNLISEVISQPLEYALKTASGFGGCNLSIVFKKESNG